MKESETPETDAAECDLSVAMPFETDKHGVKRIPKKFVSADFARTLEQKNRKLVEALTESRESALREAAEVCAQQAKDHQLAADATTSLDSRIEYLAGEEEALLCQKKIISLIDKP